MYPHIISCFRRGIKMDLIDKLNIVIDHLSDNKIRDELDSIKFSNGMFVSSSIDLLTKFIGQNKTHLDSILGVYLQKIKYRGSNILIPLFFSLLNLNMKEKSIDVLRCRYDISSLVKFILTNDDIILSLYNRTQLNRFYTYLEEIKNIRTSSFMKKTQPLVCPEASDLSKVIRYKLVDALRNELDESQEYLNLDIEELKDNLNYLSDADEFIGLIEKINSTCGEFHDQFDISGLASNLREALRIIVEDTAIKISIIKGEDIPQEGTKTASARKYLKNNIFDKRDEGLLKSIDKMIDSIINILHKDGGHKMSSNKSLIFLRNISFSTMSYIAKCFNEFEIDYNKVL